jgi:hypothetical protein
MNRLSCILIAAAGCLGLVGCEVAAPGTTRALGSVDYSQALAKARTVMSQYFSVESADPDSGMIVARPRNLGDEPARVLGAASARQVATMQVQKRGDQVVARACVAVQSLGTDVFRTLPRTGDNYSTVPDETPAQKEAATTAEQNQSWRTERYDHQTERKMLDDLAAALQGSAKPSTVPGK